jgi:hypothetical protein
VLVTVNKLFEFFCKFAWELSTQSIVEGSNCFLGLLDLFASSVRLWLVPCVLRSHRGLVPPTLSQILAFSRIAILSKVLRLEGCRSMGWCTTSFTLTCFSESSLATWKTHVAGLKEDLPPRTFYPSKLASIRMVNREMIELFVACCWIGV